MRLVKLKATKRINGLHFTPDGRRLLAVGGETQVQIEAAWVDVAEMKETLRIPVYADCCAVSPDATRIAVGGSRPFWGDDILIPPVAVFSATDPTWHEDESRWQAIFSDAEDIPSVCGLAFDPVGERLATSYDITHAPARGYVVYLTIFPLGGGLPLAVLVQNSQFDYPYPLIAFTPNGERLAASRRINGDPDVVIADAHTADRVRQFAPPTTRTHHLAFSPDGGTLAVVNGKRVSLHTVDSDVARFTLTHPRQANQVAFTPDGRRLLSACHDGQLRIWDTASGQLVTSFDWGIGQTTAVAVSLDGLTAAVGGQKGQIAVFDLD